MARPTASKPTDAEMDILRILWKRGDSTVRDVQDVFIAAGRSPSYSALSTTMRTMVAKGSIRLVDERRPQKFAAVVSQQDTYTTIAEDVTHRVFGGSIARLVRSALSGQRHSAKEIANLRKLLEQFDEKGADKSSDKLGKKPPK
jgi:BlaI family transcriptional regulator, penicillinase repressor